MDESTERDDAEKLMDALTTDQVITDDSVDLEKLRNLDFDGVKTKYNIRSDMAVYFEDAEDQILQIEGSTCLGSPNIAVNGILCKD